MSFYEQNLPPFDYRLFDQSDITQDTSAETDDKFINGIQEHLDSLGNEFYSDENINETFSAKENKKEDILSRKRKRKSTEEGAQIHDKTSRDNILRKLQVDILNCARNTINKMLKLEGYNEEFRDINYKFKKQITKKYLQEFKQKKLAEILSQELSGKFKNFDRNVNKELYQKVCNNNDNIKNFLSQNFIKFVRDVYLQPNDKISYKGIEFTIENFPHFLDINLNDTENKNKEYKEKIDEVIQKYYMPQKIFKQD